MKIDTRFTLLLFSLFGWVSSYAAEQDNWYIAWEVDVPGCLGVAYHVDQTSRLGQIYVTSWISDDVKVYDLNGSLNRTITIASSRYDPHDLVLDENGRIYIAERYAVTCLENDGTFKWRTGRNATESNRGDAGSGDGEFSYSYGITIGQDGNLYVADYSNHRVQVLDKNGTFIRKFGENGTAPGQLSSPTDVVSLPDGRVVVVQYSSSYYNLNYFQADGTFLKRGEAMGRYYDNEYVSVGQDGMMIFRRGLLDSEGEQISYIGGIDTEARTCFTSEGDLIESYGGTLRLWKRAFRTKGLPERNIIAQPAIRGVSQRAGTNVIDIDVEIIDADDSNVTLGILAAIDGEFDNPNKWIIPQAWVDYSEEKIGTPISTNQEHRLSWNVKQDWAEQTGSLQFEVFAQTGSRTKPIDVHYLTLPLNDGNLTISRSPIKDAEMVNYFKYLLVTGQSGIALQGGNIVDGNGVVLVERLSNTLQVTIDGREHFMDALGHRWAKPLEVSMAKEAATPGTVNQWSANRKVTPRGLPNQVNEYGFDVGSHGSRAWWVVKNSTLPRRDFNSTVFDNNGSENAYFGGTVAIGRQFVAVNGGDEKVNIYDDPTVSKTTWIKVSGEGQSNNAFGEQTYDFSFYYGEGTAVEGEEQSFGDQGVSPLPFKVSPLGAGTMEGVSVTPQPGPNLYSFTIEAKPGWRLTGFGETYGEPSTIASPNIYEDEVFTFEDTAVSGVLTAFFEPVGDQGYPINIPWSFQFVPGHTYVFVDGGVSQDSPFTIIDNATTGDSEWIKGGPLDGTLGNTLTVTIPDNYSGNFQIMSATSPATVGPSIDAGTPPSAQSEELALKYVVQPDDAGSISSDGFGLSFALDTSHVGNFLMVGAPDAYVNGINDVGAVYLFDLNKDTPMQIGRVVASDGTSGDKFGSSVAVAQNIYDRANNRRLIVVGAPFDDPNGIPQAGAAYVYRWDRNDTLTELAKLTAPDGRTNDYFGNKVAVDGNFIALGVQSADVDRDGSLQGNAGKVYLYKMVDGNVSYVETLTFEYPAGSSWFGCSLSIDNDTLVVGHFKNTYDHEGNFIGSWHQGTVSVYKLSENSPARLTAFLKSPEPVENGFFGSSVDLQGNQLLVGAYQEDSERAADSGAAYLFEISEDGKPTLIERFTHPQAKAEDRFGISVGVSGRNLVIGADRFDLPNERWNAGQAIFYRASE